MKQPADLSLMKIREFSTKTELILIKIPAIIFDKFYKQQITAKNNTMQILSKLGPFTCEHKYLKR